MGFSEEQICIVICIFTAFFLNQGLHQGLFFPAAHSQPEVTLAVKMAFDNVITSKLWKPPGQSKLVQFSPTSNDALYL